MSRVLRPFRNLGLGLLVLVLFLPLALLSVAALLVALLCFFVVIGPVALVGYPLAFVAALLWLTLAIPSLVICGDFSWPCTAARFTLAPVWRVGEWANESDWVERAIDAPMEVLDRAWSAYGRLASRIEGC